VSHPPSRPVVLRGADAPKAWGWELWLTATRPPGEAFVAGTAQSLASVVEKHPEVLGRWARQLFGDAMPIFAKLIHTNFPGRVHMGFRRSVERSELLAWLDAEQALLRQLLGALRLPNQERFAAYESRYAAWASEQALAGWGRDDDAVVAAALGEYVDDGFALRPWLGKVRDNRRRIADSLNEVDLAAESGNLLLMGAGTVHAIFGLSHQTHPKDRSRKGLETLFGSLAQRAAAGATDEELSRVIDDAGLEALRSGNTAPPKNEAWLPTTVGGESVLVEPQQTSDTTYSLADFYTPLVWSDGQVGFRKGDPKGGVSRERLAQVLEDVDLGATSVASMRRSPTPVPGGATGAARLFRLVDEPAAWPFFTAYQLELHGRAEVASPPGVFQQLVVTRGEVELGDGEGPIGTLSPHTPAFVPARFGGRYCLTAREPSTVLVFGVPGARGGAPTLFPGPG